MKFPGNMGNMQGMMKQAQEMQKRMGEEIAQIRVEASSGGGMVTVRMDGNKSSFVMSPSSGSSVILTILWNPSVPSSGNARFGSPRSAMMTAHR